MIIPNLPFGYKTRDWWAKAIKQIAETAAQVLPSHSSEDAGKVLKVGGTGNLEWGTDEGVPEGGQIGDVLTKGESGPGWAPPAEELPDYSSEDAGKVLKVNSNGDLAWGADAGLPEGGQIGDVLTKAVTGPGWFPPVNELPVIHADDVGKVLGIVENGGEQIPMWTSQVKGTEDSGRVTLEQVTDAANGQIATLELYHDEQSGYTDRPTAFLGITASNGRANIEMGSKQRPEVLFDIGDATQYYSPKLSGAPARWWNESLITKRYVDDKVLTLFPKVVFQGQASAGANGLPISTSLTDDELAKYKLLVLCITPMDFSSGNILIGQPFLAFFERDTEAGQNTVWNYLGDTMSDDFIDTGTQHNVKLTYLRNYHNNGNNRIAYNATLGKWMAEGYAPATSCRYGELNLENLSDGATAAITCRVFASGPSSFAGLCTSFQLSRVFGFYVD